ncbi:MAG: hypothetical protein ACRD2D_14395 [Terriglobales bacterium]
MLKLRHVWLLSALFLSVPVAMAAQGPSSSLTSALRWRSVGPFTGGRATTVAGIPGQPNVFFLGTAGGGVWETTEYGHNCSNFAV